MFRFIPMLSFLVICTVAILTIELLPLNHLNTIDIMHKLPLILVPSRFVFLIYLLIIPLLIMWMNHHKKDSIPKELSKRRAVLFYLVCLDLVLIAVLWHYELFVYLLIAFAALLFLNLVLYFTYESSENTIYQRMPVGMLFGWHIFLTMFLTNYMLTMWEWTGWGISQGLWSVIFLTITTAVGLHFLYHFDDFAFNIPIMWGFINISFTTGVDSLFVTIAALFLTVVMFSCIFIFKSLKTREV